MRRRRGDDLVAVEYPLEQISQTVRILRPHDQIDLRDPPQQRLALLLRDAAGDHDRHVLPRPLANGVGPQEGVDLRLRVLADGAGVEDHHLGGARLRGLRKPERAQLPFHPLRIRRVHLAAHRLDGVLHRHALGLARVLHQLAVGRRRRSELLEAPAVLPRGAEQLDQRLWLEAGAREAARARLLFDLERLEHVDHLKHMHPSRRLRDGHIARLHHDRPLAKLARQDLVEVLVVHAAPPHLATLPLAVLTLRHRRRHFRPVCPRVELLSQQLRHPARLHQQVAHAHRAHAPRARRAHRRLPLRRARAYGHLRGDATRRDCHVLPPQLAVGALELLQDHPVGSRVAGQPDLGVGRQRHPWRVRRGERRRARRRAGERAIPVREGGGGVQREDEEEVWTICGRGSARQPCGRGGSLPSARGRAGGAHGGWGR
mmetsp:Transcript_24847/g.59998  ORF Transcript_24847/g.59998 Transcript_24847/m.59998 type:complete len:430 (+) Transcript_24847:402-1691(+)